LIAVIGIFVLSVALGAVVTVPAGSQGVLMTWGKPVATLDSGLHFIMPIAQSVILMDTRVQRIDTVASAASHDLQDVNTTIAVNYHIDQYYTMDIFTTIGSNYQDKVISPAVEENIKATTSNFVAESLVTNRTAVKVQFENLLIQRLSQYHIVIDSVSIINFKFSPNFTAAIEAKVTAEQRALEAKNKLEQIRYEAQQQVIQAQAYANATVTRAEADSKAIKLLQLQLTPEYIKYLAILGWDGKLPTFMGSGAVPFIDIPTS